MNSCKSQAFLQKRKGTKASAEHQGIRSLKSNKSRKLKLEHWKSQGWSGQAASVYCESKKFKLLSEEEEFEISMITDMDEPENEQSKTPARTTMLEKVQGKAKISQSCIWNRDQHYHLGEDQLHPETKLSNSPIHVRLTIG